MTSCALFIKLTTVHMFLQPLARLGARVCGVDASKEAIESARWHSSLDPDLRRNITYTCCAVEDMVDSQAENFDGVIASEIVEHVANPTAFIASCCKLVKVSVLIIEDTAIRKLVNFITVHSISSSNINFCKFENVHFF